MVPSEIETYLHSLIPDREPLIMEIEQYAKEQNVPIMELIGIEALLQLLRIIQPSTILEVGAAIGYSSIRMVKAIPNAKVVTIERDEERYDKALYYIDKANVSHQIDIILGDALEVNLEQTFDVIFIDATKGKYLNFFEKYEKLLTEDGVIISDNVLFKGLVAENNRESTRRMKSLIRKIQHYNEWLMHHPNYDTTIVPIGDGIAISKKKEGEMMKKPELLVTPTRMEDIEPLIEAGADAFMLGEQHFGLRLAGEFSRDDIKKTIELAHSKGKKVYVAMNAIFHNDKVDELGDYLNFLSEQKVDAVVFGDPAVLMVAKQVAPNMRLHWNTETTATNYFTCNYWGRKGAKRAVLAREINMDTIIEMKENAEVEIEVQVHGMTCMFQSKRSLLGNYFEYQGKEMEIEKRTQDKSMFLHDTERENKYPIFEDENGTHIMSPNDICIIDELEEMIDAGIDSLKIDGILKSSDYLIQVTKGYRTAIDLCVEDRDAYEEQRTELLEKIEEIQPSNRKLDTGFFFKETVY